VALTQLPDRWRSKPILIRADGAGYFYALIIALSQQGLEFSVGYPVTDAIRDAIRLLRSGLAGRRPTPPGTCVNTLTSSTSPTCST